MLKIIKKVIKLKNIEIENNKNNAISKKSLKKLDLKVKKSQMLRTKESYEFQKNIAKKYIVMI